MMKIKQNSKSTSYKDHLDAADALFSGSTQSKPSAESGSDPKRKEMEQIYKKSQKYGTYKGEAK